MLLLSPSFEVQHILVMSLELHTNASWANFPRPQLPVLSPGTSFLVVLCYNGQWLLCESALLWCLRVFLVLCSHLHALELRARLTVVTQQGSDETKPSDLSNLWSMVHTWQLVAQDSFECSPT